MMFRKWMIGACVAVAAAMGSAAAQAQYSYTYVELDVGTRLQIAKSQICMFHANPHIEQKCSVEAVAPYSETTVTLPVDSAEGENYRIEVKVKNRPPKVLKIKRSDVVKLMQKSGFTSGVHPTVRAVVDKYGNVTFGGVYLKKDVAP